MSISNLFTEHHKSWQNLRVNKITVDQLEVVDSSGNGTQKLTVPIHTSLPSADNGSVVSLETAPSTYEMYYSDGSTWHKVSNQITVTPSTTTQNSIVIWDSTDGTRVSDSLCTIDGSGQVTAPSMKTDIIEESTPSAGVTIEGVLLKDIDITSDTITATTQLKTNTINEESVGNGVSIEGTELKDGGITTGDVIVSGSVKGSLPSGDWNATYGIGNYLYNGNTGSKFGASVDISADGSTMVVGAPYQYVGVPNRGINYIYNRDPITKAWTYQTYLRTATAGNSYEGWSVALSANGNVCVSGARGNNWGKNYVYSRNPETQAWSLVGTYTDGGNDYEGYSVSISDDGTRFVAGAIYYDGTNTDCGAVMVYNEDTSTPGTFLATPTILKQDDASGLYEGCSVSLSGDGNTLAVSNHTHATNTGRTVIYTYNGTSWDSGQLCQTASATSSFESTGVAVSYDGNRVVSAASASDVIYVYDRDTDTGLFPATADATITCVGLTVGDHQCLRISPDGKTIMAGCRDSNLIRVFNVDTDGIWVATTTLSETGNVAQGLNVAFANAAPNDLIVASGDDQQGSYGAVYVYDYTNTGIEFKSGNNETILKVVGSELANINYPRLSGGVFGQAAKLSVDGADANIDLKLSGKGTGTVYAENFTVSDFNATNISAATITATTQLKTNTINEESVGVGVTIDGVTMINGGIEASDTITSLGTSLVSNPMLDMSAGGGASSYRRCLLDYYGTDVRLRARNWSNTYAGNLYLGNHTSEMGGSGAGTRVRSLQPLTVSVGDASTSTTTGALVVSGGTGIAGDLNVGGSVETTELSFDGTNTLSTLVNPTTWTVNATATTNLTGTPSYTDIRYSQVGDQVVGSCYITGFSETNPSVTTVMTFDLPVATAINHGGIGGSGLFITGYGWHAGNTIISGGAASVRWNSQTTGGAITVYLGFSYTV